MHGAHNRPVRELHERASARERGDRTFGSQCHAWGGAAVKKSDRIMEAGSALCVGPLEWAIAHVPKGWPRFICIVLALPCCLATTLISGFYLLAGTIVSMWEVANE